MQNEVIRQYRLSKAKGSELTMRITAPPPASSAARHIANSVNEPFEYSLCHLQLSDMVDISIHNADNQQDMPIRLIFSRRDQISRDVLYGVFEKVMQSNTRYQDLDTLAFHVL